MGPTCIKYPTVVAWLHEITARRTRGSETPGQKGRFISELLAGLGLRWSQLSCGAAVRLAPSTVPFLSSTTELQVPQQLPPSGLSSTPGPRWGLGGGRVSGVVEHRDSSGGHQNPCTLISRWRGKRGPGGLEEGEKDCGAQPQSCAREGEGQGLPSSLWGSGDSGM